MNSKGTPRCLRCGTLLRNGRVSCPSCGWGVGEVASEEATSASASGSQGGRPAVRAVAAKTGIKICPICTASVVETEMCDVKGQQVCASCAEGMRLKSQKKQAG